MRRRVQITVEGEFADDRPTTQATFTRTVGGVSIKHILDKATKIGFASQLATDIDAANALGETVRLSVEAKLLEDE